MPELCSKAGAGVEEEGLSCCFGTLEAATYSSSISCIVMFIKRILSCLIFLSLAQLAHAKCNTSGLTFWPTSKTIKANSILMVEGYADSQAIIRGLGTSYEAFFQLGAQRVPLQVKDILVGQVGSSQALLQPSAVLKVGKQYELIIRGKGAKAGNMMESVYNARRGRVFYTIEAGLDQTPPFWVAPLREQAKHYAEMGCGPEVAVNFTGIIYDQSEYLVKAAVQDLTNGNTTTYYLRPNIQTASYYLQMDDAGLVSLGHGMCAGAFELEKGNRFFVTFSLLDASGNSTPWMGSAISFTRPLERS
jgi:hypothetical protein